ncbi:MAG TPA: family 10 glycosylhydrolase [Chthoniobacterales bacterium]
MRRLPSLGFSLLSLGMFVLSAAGAEREFRGAWVATVFNLDWPSRPGLPPATQQAQLQALLDRAAELHLNAILLQVRPASDALYASRLEPWSQFLSGETGVSPGYDPLAFAIGEAHARGLELHAWVNPFRAAISTTQRLPENHVAKKHPEWVRRFGKQLWIDPGDPDARQYVIDVISDLVGRYNVDGLHLDDYFYPYPLRAGESTFPDESTWQRFGRSSGLSRAEWRRQNINDFVHTLYDTVKALKPRARVGISPFGIWRPGVPSTIRAGVDSYGQLFADSRKWLAQGWVDYLAPQLYWSIEPSEQSFPVLLDWWRAQSHGKPIWPGIATERIGSKRPAREIVKQIELTRRGTSSPGQIHWSMKALMRDQGGIDELLRRGPYAEKAELPGR